MKTLTAPLKLDGHPQLKKATLTWEGKGSMEFAGRDAFNKAADTQRIIMSAFQEGVQAANAQMAALLDAASAIVKQYNTMPDGELGKGLTNGHFFQLRDALEALHEQTEGA